MNRRITIISALVLVIIIGLIAGFFTNSIQKALSVSNSPNGSRTVTAKGQAPAATTMPMMPAQGIVNKLAEDTFQRQNQQFWGTASDGRTWQGDANQANAFSITNKVGQIANTQGTLNALLGTPSTNQEVVMSGSLNHFNKGQVNIGVVLRWNDAKNWYKVLIDGTHVMVIKRVNGVTTTLGTMPFQAQDGVLYSLRFRTIGAMLFARVWLAASVEPQNWILNVTDTTLTTGQAGIRVVVQNTTVVNIASFSVLPATMGNTA